jgi:2-desacetyl-2-hydroxyethyl bacteriochlorophyllide A dehydrogenase
VKAAVYLDVGQVSIQEKPTPDVSAEAALVKVVYSGICGSDLWILSGRHPRAKRFLTFGHEFMGRIDKVHEENESGLQVGDLVVVNPLLGCGNCFMCKRGNTSNCIKLRMIGIDFDGGMAEYAAVPLANLIKIRNKYCIEKNLALTEPVAVAIHAIHQSGIKKDDSTLIIGAGPIGLLLAYTLNFLQTKKVIIAEIAPGRIELAQKISDVHVVDGRSVDMVQEILSYNNNEQIDYVFEASGSRNGIEISLGVVAPKGKVVQVGVHEEKREIDLVNVVFKEIHIMGVRVYTEGDFLEAIDILNTKGYNPQFVVTHVFPLEDVKKALDTIYSGNSVGKVLISP